MVCESAAGFCQVSSARVKSWPTGANTGLASRKTSHASRWGRWRHLLGIGLTALLGVSLTFAAHAQATPSAPVSAGRYWVSFADKNGVRFDPKTYFTPVARARRRRQGLPAADDTDRPVRADYLAAVRAGTDTVTVISRWLNGVACRATSVQAAALARLPGVARVAAWPVVGALVPAVFTSRSSPGGTSPSSPLSKKEKEGGLVSSSSSKPDIRLETRIRASPPSLLERGLGGEVPPGEPRNILPADYLLARRQTAALGRAACVARGLLGQGVRIAVLDVGFRGVPTHVAFAELRREGRIAATYDFLKNRPDVYRSGAHGTEVLGCLAGRLPGPDAAHPGPALGLAPAATYLLARTEGGARARYSAEEAWLRAVEWADQQGADIVSSSLAYTEERYFPEQMDGRHSLIGRAATLAARKGLLVVSAAGNDGDDDWRRIGTPADADSVLAVGGLDPATGLALSFSSVGPSADRRLKPDVAAFGIVLTTRADGGYERLEGTSFAAPLVAGLAACAWQLRKGKMPAGQLYQRLRAAGELYPYYDYAHGYGCPLAARLLAENPASATEPTFDFVVHDSLVAVVLRAGATLPPARPLPLLSEADERAPGAAAWLGPSAEVTAATDPPVRAPGPPLLYWHLATTGGVLRRYEVRAVSQRLVVQVPRRLLRGGDVLRVWFGSYTGQYAE